MTGQEYMDTLSKLTKRDLNELAHKHGVIVSYGDTKNVMTKAFLRWVKFEGGDYRATLVDVDQIIADKAKPDPSKLSTAHPDVKRLIAATYPDYRGRKVQISMQDTYHMEDYWAGGSRTYVKALDLATFKVSGHTATNPFEYATHAEFDIPDGVAMVEHIIFCGKDLGIRIVVNTNTYPKMLGPSPTAALPAWTR